MNAFLRHSSPYYFKVLPLPAFLTWNHFPSREGVLAYGITGWKGTECFSLHSGFHVEISADLSSAISLAKYSSRIGSIIQRQMESFLLLEGIRWFTKGIECPLIISPAALVFC